LLPVTRATFARTVPISSILNQVHPEHLPVFNARHAQEVRTR